MFLEQQITTLTHYKTDMLEGKIICVLGSIHPKIPKNIIAISKILYFTKLHVISVLHDISSNTLHIFTFYFRPFYLIK